MQHTIYILLYLNTHIVKKECNYKYNLIFIMKKITHTHIYIYIYIKYK